MDFIYYVKRKNNYEFTHFKEWIEMKWNNVKSNIISINMLLDVNFFWKFTS